MNTLISNMERMFNSINRYSNIYWKTNKSVRDLEINCSQKFQGPRCLRDGAGNGLELSDAFSLFIYSLNS